MPIMRIDDVLNTLGERIAQQGRPFRYFTTLDLASGFYQIPLEKQSRDYTAFSFSGKRYRFRRMPMGLQTSSGAFVALMENILGTQLASKGGPVSLYVDDLLVASASFQDHLNHLESLLKTLTKYNLKVHLKKPPFSGTKLTFLGLC